MYTFIIGIDSISREIDKAERYIKSSPFWSVVIHATVFTDNIYQLEEKTHSLCAQLIWRFERELKARLGKEYYTNRSVDDVYNYTFTFYRFVISRRQNGRVLHS